MPRYEEMDTKELERVESDLQRSYQNFKTQNLSLNMARGKPSSEQLDLSMPLLDVLSSASDYHAADGTDCRNYGVGCGLPEARALMAGILDDKPEHVIVFGNSSLSIMYDTIARCWNFGTLGSTPWSKLPTVSWLCPVPGYDRHFGITQAFGIKMINVPLNDDGPDMDMVERLVAQDDSIKGIWCVPKYANPSGITYSDETVDRLANMTCAADDFRIFWDNAYSVHHLSDDPAHQDQLKDIATACQASGHPERAFKFASTSKITFPGAGISALAAGPQSIEEIKQRLNVQIISHDKINQLRHVRFLKDAEGIAQHMAQHAALIRPKFELVETTLDQELSQTGCATWSNPHGGYFISFNGLDHTAQKIVKLAADAGVTLTDAGATYPYGNDPHDCNIRIAPTLPTLDQLKLAMDVFVCCVKYVSIHRILETRAN